MINQKIISDKRVVGNKKGSGTILISALLLLSIFAIAASDMAVNDVSAQTSPSLGAAGSYSVLAGSTVGNTGSTLVSGDLGVYPSSTITGFPPGTVGGTIHSGDANAHDAQAADTTAFGDLTQTCTGFGFGTGNVVLDGKSLGPGVYCADTFSLSGTLTLSGVGVWIFRAGSTLTTSGNVVGGDPCNVWWQVGSSATLNTGTQLIGNILASASITLDTGATLNGRALAQNGVVTLDTNTVNGPTCEYYLTMTAGTGGTVAPVSGWENAGAVVTITATANSGYAFDSWTVTGATCTGPTGTCAFSMPSNAVTVTANFALTVTVKLLDSGNGVSGGVVDYYDTSWHSFGTTDATGAVSMSMSPGTYLFRMTYANVQLMYSQNVGTNPTVTFQAKLVTVKLLASDGTTALPGTVVKYQSTSGAWVTFGSGTTTTTQELLVAKYVFEVIYAGGTASMAQDVSVNPTVLFHTVKVTEQLKNSAGNGLSGGAAKYYGITPAGWVSVGTTGADGTVSVELLPATYTFRMVYASGTQDLSQNVGTNPMVLFQTTLVTMKLLNHDGSAQLNGVASYTGGTFGSGTTTTTMQLLPVTYTFKVSYGGITVSTSQNVGTNPTVIFQTGQVHSTSGKCTGYTYGTFTQNMELLPGTYKFYFSDGTATTSYTIVAGTINTIH